MATANHLEDNITVSGEAVDLLGGIADEMDAVVLNIAKNIAKNRAADMPEGSPIEVEAEDVKIAAEAVLSHIKVQIAEGKLPSN
jgi:hypothetical protein